MKYTDDSASIYERFVMNNMYSLGMELSTQSTKLAILDFKTTEVMYTVSFNYDDTFPEYHTSGGVLP